jgi:hypothetical protein
MYAQGDHACEAPEGWRVEDVWLEYSYYRIAWTGAYSLTLNTNAIQV